MTTVASQVVIVGGGIAGMTVAYYLGRAGVPWMRASASCSPGSSAAKILPLIK